MTSPWSTTARRQCASRCAAAALQGTRLAGRATSGTFIACWLRAPPDGLSCTRSGRGVCSRRSSSGSHQQAQAPPPHTHTHHHHHHPTPTPHPHPTLPTRPPPCPQFAYQISENDTADGCVLDSWFGDERRCITDWQSLEPGDEAYVGATVDPGFWTYGAHIVGECGRSARPRPAHPTPSTHASSPPPPTRSHTRVFPTTTAAIAPPFCPSMSPPCHPPTQQATRATTWPSVHAAPSRAPTRPPPAPRRMPTARVSAACSPASSLPPPLRAPKGRRQRAGACVRAVGALFPSSLLRHHKGIVCVTSARSSPLFLNAGYVCEWWAPKCFFCNAKRTADEPLVLTCDGYKAAAR